MLIQQDSDLAAFFEILSHPIRIAILRLLFACTGATMHQIRLQVKAEGKMHGVGLSKHISLLCQAGLLTTTMKRQRRKDVLSYHLADRERVERLLLIGMGEHAHA